MLKMVKNAIFSIKMGINGVFVLILKWDMCVKISTNTLFGLFFLIVIIIFNVHNITKITVEIITQFKKYF